ncbi:PC4-domain-containing protein [Dentipellis sp. KUC8613]|nr:PC4-domain-containing protein [Dentipellis sp. KUC8613]
MAPKSKRKADDESNGGNSKAAGSKTAKKPKISDFKDGEESSGDEQVPLSKRVSSKKNATSEPKEDEEESKVMIRTNTEGDKYIDIGKKKRVTVRKFKGNVLIDIREYWGEEGDEKPGKKGISLSGDQWKSLTEAAQAIDMILAKMK